MPRSLNMEVLTRLDDELFLQEIRNLYFRFPETILYSDETFDIVPLQNSMTVIRQFPGTRKFLHTHDCFEIDYVFKGRCELTFLNEKRILEEGDFCILPPFTTHDTTLLSKNSYIFPILIKANTFSNTIFPMLSGDNIITNYFKKVLFDSENTTYLLFQTNASHEIRDTMKHLFLECFHYDKFADQCCVHWLHLLFAMILRDYKTYSQFSGSSDLPDYAPIFRYLQSHYATITLQELADEFHYSVPYLSKIIKTVTLKNFTTLVKHLKMGEALRYLEETSLSIEEISMRVGYSSADYFYQVFRDFQGISPQKYRAQFQSKGK